MSFVGWKAFRFLGPDKYVLVGGSNPKLFRDSKHAITRGIYKPFFYFGPVVHRAPLPTPTNLHGLWSFTSIEELREQKYHTYGGDVIAKVRVFGTVIEYERIYRSSSIAFDEMFLTSRHKIRTKKTDEMIAALEKRYHCDVHQTFPFSLE